MKDVADMTRDELRAEAKLLNIAGRGKMSKDELAEAVKTERNDPKATDAQTHVSETTNAVSPVEDHFERAYANDFDNEPVQILFDEAHESFKPKVVQPKPLPMTAHRRSKLRKQVATYGGYVVTHMPNSERVQKYARQNWTTGPYRTRIERLTKLTHRQMRRVRKNANKHGEHLQIANANWSRGELRKSYSLLARTPDGLGIFYQFSK